MTVKLNLARIKSITMIMEEIENIQRLIEYYSKYRANPAYITCKNVGIKNIDIQIDREVMVHALTEQINQYIISIEERYGFEYDPDAPLSGDK